LVKCRNYQDQGNWCGYQQLNAHLQLSLIPALVLPIIIYMAYVFNMSQLGVENFSTSSESQKKLL